MAASAFAPPVVQAPPQVAMPAYVAPPAPVANPMAQEGMAPSVNTAQIVSALMNAYQSAQSALAKQGPGVAASPQALRTIGAVPSVLGRLAQTGAVSPADAMNYESQSARTQEMANAGMNDFASRLAGAQADYAGKVYGANTGLAGREYTGNLGYASHIAGANIAAQQAQRDSLMQALARQAAAGQEATARYAGAVAPLAGAAGYAPSVAAGYQKIQDSYANALKPFMPAPTQSGGLPNMGG